MRKVIQALFSPSRANVLSTLLLHPEKEWSLSDLAKHLRVQPSTLQRELARLSEAEIITRREEGNRVFYRADERCPILPELQGLFLKTSGLVDVLRDCLRLQRKNIELAVIFGSVARGEELSKSDVDLLIVGEVGLEDISAALKRAEARLGREIQVFVYRPEEFRGRIQSRDHFVTSVFSGRVLTVFGDRDAYLEAA